MATWMFRTGMVSFGDKVNPKLARAAVRIQLVWDTHVTYLNCPFHLSVLAGIFMRFGLRPILRPVVSNFGLLFHGTAALTLHQRSFSGRCACQDSDKPVRAALKQELVECSQSQARNAQRPPAYCGRLIAANGWTLFCVLLRGDTSMKHLVVTCWLS